MRSVRILVAALVALAGMQTGLGAESLKALARRLKDKGVETTVSAGTPTFTVPGECAPEWEQSLAAELGRHYQSDKKYWGVAISYARSAECSRDDALWADASKHCGSVAQALERQGVPTNAIEIHVQFVADCPKQGALKITFCRKRSWLRRTGDNLVSGVTDVAASPFELPKGVYTRGKKHGLVSGSTVGVVGGFGSAVRRAGNGAVRLLTFWAG